MQPIIVAAVLMISVGIVIEIMLASAIIRKVLKDLDWYEDIAEVLGAVEFGLFIGAGVGDIYSDIHMNCYSSVEL